MSRQSRVDFERTLARHHVDRILDGLGHQPTGVHIVVVPATCVASAWQDAAILAIRDIRSARSLTPGFDRMDFLAPSETSDATDYDVEATLMRTEKGIDSGLDSAACTVFFVDEQEAEHASIMLADSVIRAKLETDLMILAAAHCGREITESDALLLVAMPWRRRRVAISSNRAISETYHLHIEASTAEEGRKAKEELAAKKPSERSVPDVRPLSEMSGYGDAQCWGLELARDLQDWRDGAIGWSDVDNGILLSGPPGCGKTTFAAALAASLDAHLVIGSYAAWIGSGEGHQGDLIKAMRSAFNEAHKHAPAVILIDEIDNFVARGSIGHGRSDEWMRGVVNALLECMDGAIEREGVIVVGATNDASGIDAALRRPGRLDRHVAIPLPDAEARVAILEQHLGVKLPDLSVLKSRTAGMSGADLERCARDARRIARREATTVNLEHLLSTLPKLKRRSKEDVRQIATHEVGHAVCAAALGFDVVEVLVTRDFDPDVKANVAGVAAIRHRDGRRDFQWYTDRIAQLLAGLAAEQMIYGSHGDGVLFDLSEATELTTYVLTSLGMGASLVSDGHRDAQSLAQARSFDPILRRRIEDALQVQAERARGILERHREAFDELVELLILRGRLDGREVHETVQVYAQSQLPLAI